MGLLVFFGVIALVTATALVRAYAELDDDFLAEWAAAHGLRVTDENRPMVRWYLRNARVLRTWGALAGYFLPFLAGAAFGWLDFGALQLVSVFLGYLLGALYAEVSLVRPRPVGARAASLVPRPLGAYLPGPLRATQRLVGAGVATCSLAVALVPFPAGGPPRPDPWWTILSAAGGLGLAFGLERLQGWLVRRPQPFTAPALVAADDAIRAQSVHSVAGSGIAVELVWLSSVTWMLAQSDLQLLRWTLWVPSVFGVVAAIGACQYYGHRAWRVRRPLPPPVEGTASA